MVFDAARRRFQGPSRDGGIAGFEPTEENEVEMTELLSQLWTPELQAAFTVVVVLLVILYVLSIVWVVRDAYLRGSYWYVWAIVALIPLALKGVRYRPRSTASVLRGNLLVYGLGGVIAPFIGIKLIDIVISAVGLV